MKHALRIGFVTLAAFGLAVSSAPANEMTVGSFLQDYAQARNLSAADPASAADSLRSVGVRLPAGLTFDKQLTEADIVQLTRAAGLKVTTSRPEAPFGEQQVERLFLAFSDELGLDDGAGGDGSTRDAPGNGNEQGQGPDFDPFAKGKGKGKQTTSPTDPAS